MIFVLDNYDSFTYNLVQYLGELGENPVVRRNDALSVDEVLALRPAGIVISPGPGVPGDAGISVPLVRAAADSGVPVLGVCLGHQAIAEAFDGRVIRAQRVMHGKTSRVAHRGANVFQGLPSPFLAMRYHSLIVPGEAIPSDLTVTAWTADLPEGAEVMGLAHKTHPIYGVQFHPESVGTAEGPQILRNFVDLARRAA
jgi:anthranilate synthase component 2